MLTRKSSAMAKSKMLVFIPVALVCLLCFSKDTFSQRFEKHHNLVIYRGNKFEYGVPYPNDTMTMIDPVNGKEVTKIIHHDPIPFRMNGEKIYNSDTVTAVPFAKDGLLEDRILKGIAAELDQLPDGAYSLNISNVVIGKHGEVAYYQNDGFYDANNFTSKNDLIPLKLRGAINTKIDELFHNAPYFQPGTVNQKNVPVLSNVYLFYYLITVKDHKATVTKRH